MSTLPESAYNALGLPSDTVKILMNPKPTDTPATIAAPNLLQNDTPSAGPVAPNESSITLYAELLLHIRTITLFASLRTHHTHETKAQLSTDGVSVTVSHESHSATIRLPIKVQGGSGGDAALHLPAQPPSKELTLRLQMEEREGSDLLGTLQSEERKANIVPWNGASLSQMQDVEVLCKSCEGVVVPRGKVGVWRDLPNENWAEMMDFWHCHKPDEKHLHNHENEEAVGKKGYAAGNRLQAREGTGFVDLTSFLLEKRDCEGVKVRYTSSLFARISFLFYCLCNTPGAKKAIWPLPVALSSIQPPQIDGLIAPTMRLLSVLDVSSSLCRWITGAVEWAAWRITGFIPADPWDWQDKSRLHVHILFLLYTTCRCRGRADSCLV